MSVNKNEFIGVVATGAAAYAGTTTIAVADASDFAGFYLGAATGVVNQQLEEDEIYTGGSQAASGFVGYNWVNGGNVFGVEAEVWGGTSFIAYSDTYGINDLSDVRFRVGQAVGDTLFYATIGGWTVSDLCFEGCGHDGASGVSYGVGFEHNFTPDMFFGADFTMRTALEKSTDWSDKVGKDPGTVSIRAGFRFH